MENWIEKCKYCTQCGTEFNEKEKERMTLYGRERTRCIRCNNENVGDKIQQVVDFIKNANPTTEQ